MLTNSHSIRRSVLLVLGFWLCTIASAQVPQQLSYQGIARTSTGEPISYQQITVRLSIIDSATNGNIVYQETRKLQTNYAGLFNIIIGSPGAAGVTGSVGGVNWSTGNKFIKLEMDINGSNNFGLVGITQLQSVPFALSAPISGAAMGDLTGTYPAPTIAQNSITTNKLADGTITIPKLSQAVISLFDTKLTSSDTALMLSPYYRSTLAASDFALKENVTNKSTSISLGTSDILYPTQNAVKAYVDAHATSGTPDATLSAKGKIQLAGDLAGGGSTSAAPVISNSAITTLKIADSSVTDPKILSITGSKIRGDISGNAANVNGTIAIANGGTGAGTLAGAKLNMGLDSVNNTSDLDKPVSITAQIALDAKLNLSDTLLMLSNRIKDIDTAAMLSNYLKNIDTLSLSNRISALHLSPTVFTSDVTVNLAAGKSVGKYGNGSTIPSKGKTLDEFLRDIATEVIAPIYSAPSASVSANPSSGTYEIGAPLSITLSSSFTQNDGGAKNVTTYLKNGLAMASNSNVIPSLTSTISFQVRISYLDGLCKKNNINQQDCTGQILAGSTTSSAITFTPSARRYWGYHSNSNPSDAEILSIQGGGSEFSSSKQKSSFNISVSGSSTYIFFAYPASLGSLNSITVGGFESLGAFTLVTRSVVNSMGYAQSFNIYISTNSFSSSVSNITTN
jgi:hypothetical protein